MIRNSDHCASVWRPKSVNRQRSSVARERRALQAELDRVSKQIDKLVGAIMQGADAFVCSTATARCRKLYGQLVSQGAVVDRSDIEIAVTANLVKYRTSPTFEEHFCKTCGCHLFAYEDSEPRLMYFFPSTLDGGVHPGHPAGTESHIYVGSKAEWDTICGNLPQYDTMSPDQIIIGKQRAAGEG